MKYDIHSLAVVPYIIAERALWNTLETKYGDLLNTEDYCILVAAFSDKLVAKSEHIFNANSWWRNKLTKAKDQRYYLEMFMEHWAQPLIEYQNIKPLIKGTYEKPEVR